MKRALIATLLLLTAAAAFAADADIVAAAYPQRLITDYFANYQQAGESPVRFSHFAPLGADLIVAAYTNGFSGAIRVLRRDGTVVNEPSLHITGIVPTVETVNLDGAGSDEVIVSFSSARGRETNWVFRWTGSALQQIAPLLVDAGWKDLDGDGKLEIYEPSGEYGHFDSAPEAPDLNVFHLSNGGYVPSPKVVFSRTFQRSTAAPQTAVEPFSVAAGVYTLRVTNNRSSGSISVNGVAILTPKTLHPAITTATMTVTLNAINVLAVELTGQPGSSVKVVIETIP
jgi:hypothetical protein